MRPGAARRPQIVPDPVRARGSVDPELDWEISFDATLRDAARRGIRVDRAVLTVRDSSGVVAYSESLAAIVPAFERTVPVGGSTTWSVEGVRYDVAGRSATGTLRLEMETGVGDFRTMDFDFRIR